MTEEQLSAEQITAFRRNIDEIDYKIAVLLEARAVYAVEIGKCKRALKLPMIDRDRERQVIDRLCRALKNFPESALRDVYQIIHAAMLALQIGDERNFWRVEGSPKSGYMLMSGDRVLLAVSGDEPNRLIAMSELHNKQIVEERKRAAESEPEQLTTE